MSFLLVLSSVLKLFLNRPSYVLDFHISGIASALLSSDITSDLIGSDITSDLLSSASELLGFDLPSSASDLLGFDLPSSGVASGLLSCDIKLALLLTNSVKQTINHKIDGFKVLSFNVAYVANDRVVRAHG